MNELGDPAREATELERIAKNIISLAERTAAVRERVFRLVGDVSGEHAVREDKPIAAPSNGRLNDVKNAIGDAEGAMCELEDAATALEALNL